jgi:phosphate:Na+ symporter
MNILQLILGLVLFLYGMDAMGDALKKSAGNRLKTILGKMTSSPLRGFLLGLGVTLIIQSSSATTVMVVGFVNSGTMTLLQSVGVIMGANVGTAITTWLTALSGIESAAGTLSILKWLKPDSWIPFVALIGICLLMFTKRGKKKDIGFILIGFTVLMVGMSLMSESVAGLKDNESFKNILTMFENPILGVMAGLILTAMVQSSSASVGILQSLTVTGAITYGAAIPIIMGQNIGTCVTALISSASAGKNGKRAAMIHLYFNIIAVVIWLSIFYLVNAMVEFAFVNSTIDMWGVALVHTVFKFLAVAIIAPLYKWLVKLAEWTIRDNKSERESANILDERLFTTPAIAIARAADVTASMAKISIDALKKSFALLKNYDSKLADEVRALEEKADKYEDDLGSYLVKASACDMDEREAAEITKLLHIIGDLERLSDHAVNFVESAEEIRDKEITFSAQATNEISVLEGAVNEILDKAYDAFVNGNLSAAGDVEPIEEVVDELRDQIKLNHIIRLQKSECTIEHGFVLSDLLTNFERVADHCSNIASCVVEISQHDALDMHKYQSELKHGDKNFDEKHAEYRQKYAI